MAETQIALLAGEPGRRETDAAIVACNDYLRLGPGRSLQKLIQKYAESDHESPTTHVGVLKGWSKKFAWVERASAYDAEVERSKTAEVERLRTQGLAADYERLRELGEIYALLREAFNTEGVWTEDIKLSSRGDQVRVRVVNKPLIDTMRGVLDDIAREVGGRKQKHEHTGADGGAIQFDAMLQKTYGDGDGDGNNTSTSD